MTIDARRTLDLQVSEKQFQQQIVDLARMQGWLTFHDNATNARRTCPHCGAVIHHPRNVSGFPDLVLVRGEDLIVAEVKRQTGRLTPNQEQWLRAFAGVERVEALLVKPAGWDQVVEMLTARHPSSAGGRQ